MSIVVSDCFKIGSITKTHGVNGRLIVRTDFNLELLEFDEPVFVVTDGLPVPLFIEEISEKTHDSYLVKFEFLNSANKAKEFVGCDILATTKVAERNDIELITQVIGIEIHDKTHGFIGICSAIEPIPGNPLMIINKDNNQLFIPIVKEWITEFVPNKRITIDCPAGLLNL